LSGQWSKVKKAYESANHLLGDIIKVTPSSKGEYNASPF